MNSTCRKYQEMMAAEGPQVLQKDEAAQRHLEECEACFSFLETLQELNTSLRAMPTVDAPDHLVDELLSRPELKSPAGAEVPAPEKPRLSIDWMRWTIWGSTAAFVLLLITLSLPSLYRSPMALPSELRSRSTAVGHYQMAIIGSSSAVPPPLPQVASLLLAMAKLGGRTLCLISM